MSPAHGIPLAATATGGNRNTVTQLIGAAAGRGTDPGHARTTAPAPVAGVCRPRRRPRQVPRRQVRESGITPVTARRGTEHRSGLDIYRWDAEAVFALLHRFRRLRIRWEIRNDID
jgi:hypothetical protein